VTLPFCSMESVGDFLEPRGIFVTVLDFVQLPPKLVLSACVN
jgi:hypothetical protein